MILAQQASGGGHGHGAGAGASAMNRIKALRTLRLLRILRLLRFLKGIAWVNVAVDTFLNTLVMAFLLLIIVGAFLAGVATMVLSVWVAAKSWLRVHDIPSV